MREYARLRAGMGLYNMLCVLYYHLFYEMRYPLLE